MSKGKLEPSLYSKAKTRRTSPEIDFTVSDYEPLREYSKKS